MPPPAPLTFGRIAATRARYPAARYVATGSIAPPFSSRAMARIGSTSVSALGLMEADPLLIQAEQKLIGQADELVVLVDSSKFARRSSLILCPLSRIHTVITDDGISDRDAAMLDAADVKLIVVQVGTADRTQTAHEA
jgi:DeoR/GlpR family transcriptional regulator of sugar metabolism